MFEMSGRGSVVPGVDTRNIVDKYKGWETDLIRESVISNTFPYSVCMVNLNYDFNFATVVRNANAFGAKKVYYVSESKKLDRRGMVGTNHYTSIHHLRNINDLLDHSGTYNRVAVEVVDRATPLDEFVWPENPVMIFGSEGMGLSKEVLDFCPFKTYIPMYGSVRSLNTACASAIVMADFVRKYERKAQNG